MPTPSRNGKTAAGWRADQLGDACEDPLLDDTTQADTGRHSDTEAQKHISPEGCVPESPVSAESTESPCVSVSEFLKAVWEVAKKRTVSATAKRYYLPKMQLLVALCAELQTAAGEGTFFLACRDAGELLDEDHHRVWRWLMKLERDGVIERVSTGAWTKHRANEYRFSGSTKPGSVDRLASGE